MATARKRQISLQLSAENWLTLTKDFIKQFHGAVGHEEYLNDFYEHNI